MSGKFVLILLDGLGDRSYHELDNMTPLQAAHTPFLDSLAAEGSNGLFHASLQGQALPSENAHFAMFGYDGSDFPGRGPLEALGAGIKLGKDDVAVLAHFASAREERGLLRLVRDKVESSPSDIARAYDLVSRFESQGIKVELFPVKGLFGVLILRGKVAPYITDCNPILDHEFMTMVKPWASHAADPECLNTARVVQKYLSWVFRKLDQAGFNRKRLEQGMLPLNCLVIQRAGRLKKVPLFREKFGLRGASISSGVVYAGLCRYLGMDVLIAPDLDDPGREIMDRVIMARDALKDYDFMHIHSKAPDQAGHQKDPLLKKKVIEQLDRGLGRALPGLLQDENIVLAVTADHSTPSKGSMVHSGEPVPLTIRGRGVRIDRVRKFDEVSVAGGCLGFVRGAEFMYMVLNCLDKGKLAGLMDTPHDQPYWPGNAEPFRLD
ncbi:alkaline phosphatase family protein [Desulfonatronovibrio hydrogenovorans]|uniref:alkaline phosphatase family protein n=1 Tax=Desulfonatronovibrio hydrogenovorans TaxID=53245 RepID=UPI00048A4604|nr:alkaline phosphatase family protein [Desulfonatronovibrio hydrogenovorans]